MTSEGSVLEEIEIAETESALSSELTVRKHIEESSYLETILRMMKEEHRILANQIKESEEAIHKLKSENASLLEQINQRTVEFEQVVYKLEEECKYKEAILEQTEKKNMDYSNEIVLLKEQVEKEKIRVREGSTWLIRRLEATVTDLTNRNQKLEEDNKKFKEKLAALEASQNDSNIADDLRDAVTELKKENDLLLDAVARFRNQYESNETTQLRRELETIRKEYDEIKQKFEKINHSSSKKPQGDQRKLLNYLQTLVFHIEKTKQERQYFKNLCSIREQELDVLKKKNEQNDILICLLYNQINTINATKFNHADKVKNELDKLMGIISESKKKLLPSHSDTLYSKPDSKPSN
jgi:hypothetical protein